MSVNVVRKNSCGWFGFCTQCHQFHLLFNNIFLSMTRKQINSFINFLERIDIDYRENSSCCVQMDKQIPIPTQQENLVLLINRRELDLLKHLILGNSQLNSISYKEIDYNINLN